MLGKLLNGRYRIVQNLSSGGFSQTFLAEDIQRPGNPKCVVKQLKPASNDPQFLQEARERFPKEAETLEKLGTHNQIPRLFAYFEEHQEFYLVQEFIAGQPLDSELPPGYRWSEQKVIQLLQEILSILEFVHSQNVIHRDIKPENIMRRQSDNKLVLIDFGAVKQVRTRLISAQGRSSATVAIGTQGYMPPEQGRGKPQLSSDIYALGITAIQALTGLSPTQFQEDPQTGELVWQAQVQVSPKLAAILNRMVRYHFKDRYQSATEALQALQQLSKNYRAVRSTQPPQSSPPKPTVPSPPPSQPFPSQQRTIPVALTNPYPPMQQAPTSASPTAKKVSFLQWVGIAAVLVIGFGIVNATPRQQEPASSQSPTQGDNTSSVLPQTPSKSISKPTNVPTNVPTTPSSRNGDGSGGSGKGSPGGNPIPLPPDPGPNILEEAQRKAGTNDFNGAIALAQSIPNNSFAYADAQKVIAGWQSILTKCGSPLADAVAKANAKDYVGAIALAQTISAECPNHDRALASIQQWEAIKIQDADARAAAQDQVVRDCMVSVAPVTEETIRLCVQKKSPLP